MKPVVRLFTVFFILSQFLLVFSSALHAQGVRLIRDVEIEDTIRAYATPLLTAAGLNSDDVEIYLVDDNTLNAFVAGGQKLFINTGLLMAATGPGEVIGVIAHETGHISGGHLARLGAALDRAATSQIITTILGGAALLAGRGDVGAAVFSAGQQTGQRTFLAFSRTQEGAADQAALTFLNATKQSAKGLVTFLDRLKDQELLTTASQDPYVRTHPVTLSRIDTIKAFIKTSPYSDVPPNADFIKRHERVRAKLIGYSLGLGKARRTYKDDLTSEPARYALAIAYYRKGELKKALPLINSLLKDEPEDPYFNELKGQMLYENGRPKEALPPYIKTAELLPKSALIRRALAQVQIDLGPEWLDAAIENLKLSLTVERRSYSAWRQLGIAYGKSGDIARASIALGEAALLHGDADQALYNAGKAQQTFKPGMPEWLQAEDIRNAAEQLHNKK